MKDSHSSSDLDTRGQQPAFVTSEAASGGGGGHKNTLRVPIFPQSQREENASSLKTSAVLLQR